MGVADFFMILISVNLCAFLCVLRGEESHSPRRTQRIHREKQRNVLLHWDDRLQGGGLHSVFQGGSQLYAGRPSLGMAGLACIIWCTFSSSVSLLIRSFTLILSV